jgi:hypothetical protein
MAKLETSSAGDTLVATRLRGGKSKRTTAVKMVVQAAAVMTAMQAVQDGTRRLAEVGRRES